MRSLFAALALLSLISAPVQAGPKEDALLVIEKWSQAFSDSDVDAIVKLYALDAQFIGTGSKQVVMKPEDIRKYFEAALLRDRPRGAILTDRDVRVLSDTTVVVAGLDKVTGVRDGQPINATGRVTFVVAKRGADWQIVHFHRSAMPN